MDLYEELIGVLRALEEAKLDYALCGGLALGIYGYPRLTKDIDLLVRRKDVPKIKAAVARVGFTLEAAPMTFRAGTDRETCVHRVSKASGEELLLLDLIEIESHMREIWKARAFYTIRGQKVRAVTREGLIQMKTRSGRPQDAVDVQRLVGESDEGA